MEMPNIVTSCKIQGTNFSFHVRAYRKLTDNELKVALKMWKQQNHVKKVPQHGEVTVITTIGFDPSSGL